MCECERGWNGTDCDQEINACVPDPCQYGTCTVSNGRHLVLVSVIVRVDLILKYSFIQDLAGEYVCVCEPGWSGMDCGQEINECASVSCQNGAVCVVSQCCVCVCVCVCVQCMSACHIGHSERHMYIQWLHTQRNCLDVKGTVIHIHGSWG